MSSPKITLNTEWLSVCGGCHVAIVDLHEKILEVMKVIDIQRSPLLMDEKAFPPADIGLVSGAVRTDHDREMAEKMREACKTVVAFGTCAVYGGIPGAALAHEPGEILEQVYQKSPSTDASKGVIPRQRVPGMAHAVRPLDEVIEVDLYLPGCPPHAAFIFDALLSLTKGRPPRARQETVCARCARVMEKRETADIKGMLDGLPDHDVCFMSQGYLCMGSVTLDRCLAPCPSNGVPCTGCAGPTGPILTEPNRDIRTEVATRMARLTNIPRDAVIAKIERTAKSRYAYAMASGMIRHKPTFLIKKWIEDVEGGP
jgi:F420-non-reducing hydrogenase small subunit